MNNRLLGLIAALIATSIFGFNHTIAKALMPTFISPSALLYARVLGAFILFWIIGLFFKREFIEKKDRIRLILCAIFGMSLNMITSLKGLELSTPINSSIISTTSPIIIFIISIIINAPIGLVEFANIKWEGFDTSAIVNLSYVIICTTFLVYLLNLFALRNLKATTVGIFIYFQPIIDILYAIYMGADRLSLLDITSVTMVFIGVYLVSKNQVKQ